jgi:hypothetical protein
LHRRKNETDHRSRDDLTGQVTTYAYTDSRLTAATQTGGAVNSGARSP